MRPSTASAQPRPRGRSREVRPASSSTLPRNGKRPVSSLTPQPVRPLARVLADAEAQAIEDALVASRGNRTRAAKLLGISRSVLYEKLAKLS